MSVIKDNWGTEEVILEELTVFQVRCYYRFVSDGEHEGGANVFQPVVFTELCVIDAFLMTKQVYFVTNSPQFLHQIQKQ